MFFDVLLIMLPLVFGYGIRISSATWLKRLQWLTSQMVYLILALMGIGLAFIDNLGHHMVQLMQTVALFAVCICGCNLLALWWQDRGRKPLQEEDGLVAQSKWQMMGESLRMALVVIVGFGVGLLLDKGSLPVHSWSNWALMLLLFFIGIQMRNSGMTLRQILLNGWALKIAATLVLSSWVGGLLAGLLLGYPWYQSLALSSAFGWYSLSGILVGGELGPILGSAAFLNDLVRELVAIVLIPLLMRRHPSAAIGLGGATALDFTLPVIQKSGGLAMVPIAVVSGFILSLLGPLLMLSFLAQH
jgi:uncharacterized membrane protein YbjE (DUF340 family)